MSSKPKEIIDYDEINAQKIQDQKIQLPFYK